MDTGAGTLLVRPENDRKTYTDAQLEDIVSVAPTRANAAMKAAAYGRTPSAIKVVWRIANATDAEIRHFEKAHCRGRAASFHRQVQRVAQSVGWVRLSPWGDDDDEVRG